MSTFPDGLFQYGGEPVGGARYSSPWATAYFVDGTNGYDGFDGKGPTTAKKTIQAAVTAAGYQDVIYVRAKRPQTDASDPGVYTESVNVAYAKDNLSIIGVTPHVLDPYYGPKLLVPDVVSEWGFHVISPGFHLENFTVQMWDITTTPAGAVFLESESGFAAKAGSVGASIVNCMLWSGQLRIDGGYDCTTYGVTFNNMVKDNTLGYNFSCPSTGGINPQWGMKVQNCAFLGKHAAAPTNTYMYIQGSAWGWQIRDCYFDIVPASGQFIYINGDVDGFLANCYFNSANATYAAGAGSEIQLGAGVMKVVGCHDVTGEIGSGT